MALSLSVWIIECWSVFLQVFVVQSIQHFPWELICISRITLLANSDVSTTRLLFLVSPVRVMCGCRTTEGCMWMSYRVRGIQTSSKDGVSHE